MRESRPPPQASGQRGRGLGPPRTHRGRGSSFFLLRLKNKRPEPSSLQHAHRGTPAQPRFLIWGRFEFCRLLSSFIIHVNKTPWNSLQVSIHPAHDK